MSLGVLPASGALAFDDIAFVLPGVASIALDVHYEARAKGHGPLGQHRCCSLDHMIWKDGDGLVYLDHQSRQIRFQRPTPGPGQWSVNSHYPSLRLSAGSRRSLVIKDRSFSREFRKCEDGVWRLDRIRDENLNAIVFQRDKAGLLQRLDHPSGVSLEFENDTQGHRTSVSLRGGSEIRSIARYAYDDRGNMVLADHQFGIGKSFEYDGQGNLVRYREHGRTWIDYVYDEQGRVVRSNQQGQPTKSYLYRPELRRTIVEVASAPDHPTIIDYDEHEQLVRKDVGGLLVFENTYDEAGHMVARRDGNGDVTRYTYDANGNTRYIVDAEGRRNSFSYDDESNLRLALTSDAKAWEYDYDERSNLVAVQDPNGNRTEMVNDEAGQPVRIMRADGMLEQRAYDAHQRLVALRDYRGSLTKLERDDFGRTTSVTDALGAVTRLVYEDQPGRDFWQPSRHIRPDGVVVSVAHDRAKAETRVTDGEERTTTYRYGAFDLLVELVDPKGGRLGFAYDHAQRLVAVTNQKNLVWTFERDAAGRVVRETDFDGMTLAYAYDKADQLLETRYEDGTRLVNHYDKSGLRVREDLYEPGAPDAKPTHYAYDPQGRILSARNNDALVTFERDAMGRVVAETINGRRVESSYDCCGNRTERRIGDRLVRSLYDPLGAVHEIAIDGHAPLRFTRDALGREVRRENGQGFRLDQSWDAVGQLLTQVAGTAPAPGAAPATPAVRRDYRWDKAFAPKAIADARWGTTAYTYDANGQVTEARHGDGGVERFAYDAALNIAASGFDDRKLQAWMTAPGGRVTRGYGPSGERITLTYDVCRRVTERRVERDGFRPKTWMYGWDGRDRLVRCETPDGEVWRYGYDAFARRLWKVKELTAPEQRYYAIRHPQLIDVAALAERGDMSVAQRSRLDTSAPTETGGPPTIGTCFSWDGDVVAEEAPLKLDGSVDWDAGVRWHFEPGSFRPLAREKPLNKEVSIIMNDYLGTPREIFDASGKINGRTKLSLWGSTFKHSGINNDNVDASTFPRFQGQTGDEEADLLYNRFRYYDPVLVQYASSDPIGIGGGLQTQAYVKNPCSIIDPLGLTATLDPATGIVTVPLSRTQYPEAAGHIEDAIQQGKPSLLTIERSGAAARRRAACCGQTATVPGNQIDEYPPAMSSQGGAGASTREILGSDNGGAGASIGNQLRPFPNGTPFKIQIVP